MKVCKVIPLDHVQMDTTRILWTERGDKVLLGQLKDIPAETTLGIQFSEETDDKVGENICNSFKGEYFNKIAAGFSVPEGRTQKISVEEFYAFIGAEQSVQAVFSLPMLRCDAMGGPKYRVIIAKAGETLNNQEGTPITFSKKSLVGAAPLFEGCSVRAFRHAWNFENFTHMQDTEGTTWTEEMLNVLKGTDEQCIVGALNNVVWSEEDNGLIADMTVSLASDMGRVMHNLLFKANELLGSLDKFMGLSMVVSLLMNKKSEVTQITSVDGVDVVSVPAAGGHFQKVLMSIRVPVTPKKEEFPMKNKLIAMIKKFSPEMAGLEDKTEEDLFAILEGFDLKQVATQMSPATSAVTPTDPAANAILKDLSDAISGLRNQFQATQEENAKKAMFAFAEAKIQASDLPDLSKKKLLSILPNMASFEATMVEKLIVDEKTYVDSLHTAEGFKGFGVDVEEGEGRKERLTGALDVAFGLKEANKPKYGSISIQEYYKQMTGDISMTQKYNKRFAAVTSTEFANVLGNTLYRRLLQVFAEAPYDESQLISTVKSTKDFRSIDATNVGGFGTLPTVAEDNPYLPIDHPTDWKSTYSILKKGGLLSITWETILNDDLGLVQRLITNFARAARRTHAAYVFNLMTSNPTMYDSIALFEAGTHVNLGSAALAYASLVASYNAMIIQKEPGSLFRMGLTPYNLFVPAELYQTAVGLNQSQVQSSALQYAFAYQMFGENNERIHNVPFMTDATDWYVTANKAYCELIEMSYLNGVTVPEMFTQAGATDESVFNADRINYKMRFVFGGIPVEWRGFYGAVVSG